MNTLMLSLFQLDIKTLIGLLFWCNFILSVLVFGYYLTRIHKENKNLIAIYGVSRITQSIAWLFFYLRGSIPGVLTLEIANTLLFASFYFESLVMLAMVDSFTKKNTSIQTALFLVSSIVFLMSIPLGFTSNQRVVIASLVTFIIFIFPTITYLFNKYSSYFKRYVGLIYLLFLFMMILRAVNAFIVKDVSLFTNNFIQNATFLTLAFMMVISAPSFLLLMKEDADIKLEKLATLDSLTMIPNRRHFMEHAYPLFNKHVTTQLELTTLFLDIDHFKNVNDQFGHSFGDEVLIECSRIIQENVRGSDISCRYGGEEFLIMLHQTNSEGAVIVANHIRDEISKFVFVSNPNFKYTISIGVFSKVPTQTDSIEQFIDFADQALYRAKATGRDKICVYKKGLSND